MKKTFSNNRKQGLWWILLLTSLATVCSALYWSIYERKSTNFVVSTLLNTATNNVKFKEVNTGLIEIERKNIDISTSDMSGQERVEYLQKSCEKLKIQNLARYKMYSGNKVEVRYSGRNNALFCPICKAASTFWKRAFAMMEKNTDDHIVAETPFDIVHTEHFWKENRKYFSLASNIVTPGNSDATSAFKFLVVRNPYPFLYSAFVDKMLNPNFFFWQIYGNDIIRRYRGNKRLKCGSDVTFKEFVEFSVSTILEKGHAHDCHTEKFSLCNPCSIKYTYVAQMETLAADTVNILTTLNQTRTLNVFKDQFKELSTKDAILDSLFWFSKRSEITKCIPWPKALRRLWRNLQLRGVIGSAPFPLTDEQANKINKTAFSALATEARKMSSSAERSLIKKEGFNEAYSTISPEVILKLNKAYEEDMFLFGYKPYNMTTIRTSAQTNIYINYFDYDKDLELINIQT